MQRKKRGARERRPAGQAARSLGEALDLPNEILPGFSHVELMSNREAIAEGVKGILNYSETCIRLNLGRLQVCFEGGDLVVKSYQAEQVILSGIITDIHFSN
jgi:sporulation protein YqfC